MRQQMPEAEPQGVTEIVLAVVRCGGRICVARRSQAVGTSRGLWSVVTGYVEPGTQPAAQAWRELDEELGLRPPLVRLLGGLPAVPLASPASGKRFRVFPFLFESQAECPVVLNWEHTDAAWVAPSRLTQSDCVPWQAEVVRTLLASALVRQGEPHGHASADV